MRASAILREFPRELALIVMVVCFSLSIRHFASASNLANILLQLSPVLLLAVGQAFALLTGGIDLSQSAAVGLYSVAFVWLLPRAGIPGALLVVLILAIAYGLVVGYAVSIPKGGINAFVVTLAGMYVLGGILMYLTGGTPLSVPGQSNRFLSFIGAESVGGVPAAFIAACVACFAAFVFLHRSGPGLSISAVGSNPVAAKVHGISLFKARSYAYIACALLTACSSILLSARIFQGNPHLGEGLLFDSIGGAVLGGVALNGGTGGVWAAARGISLVVLIQNALYLTDLNSYIRDIVVGLLLFFGYLLSQHRTRGTRI